MKIPIFNRFTCTENQLKYMINNNSKKKINTILDYANENPKNYNNNFKKIMSLINNYSHSFISVKLSSLNFDEGIANEIVESAIENKSKILIDAENFLVQDKINYISNNLVKQHNINQVNVYKTYQMYRKDSFHLLKNDFLQPRNYFIGCKLVRGAYINLDKKHGILYDKIKDTHYNFDKSVKFLSNKMNKNDVLMCATHNEISIDKATKLIDNKNLKNIEFAQLMGMHDKLSEKLANNYKVFKYLPYGNFTDTIPYLLRRLYENYPMINHIIK